MGKFADLVERMFDDGLTRGEIVSRLRAIEAPASGVGIQFAEFWHAFPNKTGKGAAEKAFTKAIKLVDKDAMISAVMRYAAKRDDRPWCNPATWLNQKRWEDEAPALVIPARNGLGQAMLYALEGNDDGKERFGEAPRRDLLGVSHADQQRPPPRR